MTPLQRAAMIVATANTLFLAACGGGGDAPAASSPPAQTTPAPSSISLTAVGSSGSTASLSWTRPTARATYAIERKSGGADWEPVAEVDARSGAYIDSGLAARTDYSYRLVEVGTARTMVAEGSTKTGDEQPASTAAGSAIAPAANTTLGSAGATLKSDDGAIVVQVPAGALAAGTAVATQAVTNTAPDGRGNGLKLRLDAAPTAALTLTLHYDAPQDGEADGQRIAVQRADGSWLSLPLLAIDKTARTLTAELPPSLLSAPAPGPAMRAAAAVSVSIEFTVVRYLAFHLQPRQSRLPVKKSLQLVPYARVRGYAITMEVCHPDGAGEVCLAWPVMETREMPFLNSKAGFDRHWYVFLDEGGNSTYGTVEPTASAGATFTAPDHVPDPSTVIVTFQSRNTATGRTVTLASQIEITPDRWVGALTAVNGPSDAGTTYSAIADVTWDYDEPASSAGRKVYRASGSVSVAVTDDNCTIGVTPAGQPVATNPALVELVVDDSRTPAAYTLRLITFWPATISAVCPDGSGSNPTPSAGYGWELSGVVSADGSRIEGRKTDDNGAKVEWSFTRPTADTP